MRRSVFGNERYPFIIWWICNIDLYALFSGAGNGEFIRTMILNNMLPGPETLLYPINLSGYSIIYPEENDSLPMILQMYYATFVLAIRLGFLAADFRREAVLSMGPAPATTLLKKLLGLRSSLVLLWESPNAIWLRQNTSSFPSRSAELWQQVSESVLAFQLSHCDFLTIVVVVYISLSFLHALLLYKHVAGSAPGAGKISRQRAYTPFGGYFTNRRKHNQNQ